MEIGNNIRKYRKLKGLTQKELALSIGLTAPTITKYENNSLKPDIQTLIKISTTLGITLQQLVDVSLIVNAQKMEIYNLIEEILFNLDYCITDNFDDDTITLQYNNSSFKITRDKLDKLEEDIVDYIEYKMSKLQKDSDK